MGHGRKTNDGACFRRTGKSSRRPPLTTTPTGQQISFHHVMCSTRLAVNQHHDRREVRARQQLGEAPMMAWPGNSAPTIA